MKPHGMCHKIKPIIGKGTLDFPNNWGRVKHRLGFGSFNIHLRISLKALRIDTALIYHAALLSIIVSALFVESEIFLKTLSFEMSPKNIVLHSCAKYSKLFAQ